MTKVHHLFFFVDVEAEIQGFGFGESNLRREGWQKGSNEMVKETKKD